jgi:hypothetical protein
MAVAPGTTRHDPDWRPEGPSPGAARMIRRTVYQALGVMLVFVVAGGYSLWHEGRESDRASCLSRVDHREDIRSAFFGTLRRLEQDMGADPVAMERLRIGVDADIAPLDPEDCPSAPWP